MVCDHELLSLITVPTLTPEGSKAMFFSMQAKGTLPSKAQKQFGRSKVWMPAECMNWRAWVASQLRGEVFIRGYEAYFVKDVVFQAIGSPPPDRDTVYHQLQDALTVDLFKSPTRKKGMDDKHTGHINIIPHVPVNKEYTFYIISGEFVFRKKEGR
jgi:hypothetical protein